MRSARSRTSALAALALLGGYIFGLVHLACAAHEICPEHGELLESGEPVAPVTPVAAGGRSSAATALVGPRPSHHHERCLVALGAHERTIAAGPVAIEVAWVAPDPLPVSAACCASPAVRLFRFAPKTSPPA